MIQINFSCSNPKAVVSKMLLPIGCQMAKHITANEIPVAPISFQLLKNGICSRVRLSDLHSNT